MFPICKTENGKHPKIFRRSLESSDPPMLSCPSRRDIAGYQHADFQLPAAREYPNVADMSEIEPHPLLAKVDAYRAKAKLSRSAFGYMAVGDPRFVFDLEAGREPRRKTMRRVEEFMRGASAPSGQPRPGKPASNGRASA